MTGDETPVDRRGFVRGIAGLGAAALAGRTVRAVGATSDAYERTDVTIESWDGTELVSSVYEPSLDGGDRPTGAVVGTHGWGSDRSSAVVARLAEAYAERGYVLVTYDSRGFGESGGEVGVDGPMEVADALTIIDKLGQGTVGGVGVDVPLGDNGPVVAMDGLSYAGGIQLNTMAVSSPAAARAFLPAELGSTSFETFDFEAGSPLDVAVPRWAWHDLVFSLAPREVVKSGWDVLLYGAGVAGARGLSAGDHRPDGHDVRHGLSPTVHETFVRSTATNDISDDATEFYRARSPVTKLDHLETPSLFVSGWNDTLFVPNEAVRNVHALRDNGVETRLLLFQGGHTFGETPDAKAQAHIDERALDFVDAHLAGGSQDLPPVEYYETQTGEWSRAPDLDPPAARTWTLDLADGRAGESTVVANSVAPTSFTQVLTLDRDAAPGVTAADFDFAVPDDREVLGTPDLALTVEPLGTVADVFVKVQHVTAGGADVVHNQVTPIEIEGTGSRTVAVPMTTLQRTLARGDTLRVTVATTDAGFSSSRRAGGVRIHHAPGESTVSVPVRRARTGR